MIQAHKETMPGPLIAHHLSGNQYEPFEWLLRTWAFEVMDATGHLRVNADVMRHVVEKPVRLIARPPSVVQGVHHADALIGAIGDWNHFVRSHLLVETPPEMTREQMIRARWDRFDAGTWDRLVDGLRDVSVPYLQRIEACIQGLAGLRERIITPPDKASPEFVDALERLQASYDHLVGLLDMNRFEVLLSEVLRGARRPGGPDGTGA